MASMICPTPVRQLWLYRRSGHGVWEVGFFDSAGEWCADSTHRQPAAAADRVHWLNGGATVTDTGPERDRDGEEITRLQAQVTHLSRDRDKWRNQALRHLRGQRRNRRGQR